MYSCKILAKIAVLILVLGLLLWTDAFAQSVPTAPADLEFAGVSIQLTNPARQRLQQALNGLYADRESLLAQLGTLNQIRPVLDARLLAQTIPLDFRYACPPFTESPYDPHAYWGLGKNQAQQLQLLINAAVDDRRHLFISTDAVLPYLSQLHQQNGHWIKTLFWHLDPTAKPFLLDDINPAYWLLDLKTPSAFWTILARKIAFEQEQALIRLVPSFVLLEYDDGAGKTLAEIATRLKLNSDRLSPYNSWLLADRIPTEGNFPVILRLKPEEYLAVKSRLDPKPTRQTTSDLLVNNDLGFPILRRLNPNPTAQSVIFYQINDRKGIQAQLCDNAITLSFYGNLSIPTFLSYNDLPPQAILKPGEVYYIERKARKAKIPFHVVQPSQTLSDIAALYGVRLKSLLRFNRLKANQRVQTGRIIWMQKRRPAKTQIEYRSVPPTPYKPAEQPLLPAKEPAPKTDSTAQPPISLPPNKPTVADLPPTIRNDSAVTKPAVVAKPTPTTPSPVAPTPVRASATKIHIVRPGQTYYSISKLYGTTVAQLCRWNNLSVNQPLEIGQALTIDPPPSVSNAPSSVQPTRNANAIRYHVVKPGETLYRISVNNGVTVPELMRWNKLPDYTIEVGQELIVSAPN